jgi:hypothetical protein
MLAKNKKNQKKIKKEKQKRKTKNSFLLIIKLNCVEGVLMIKFFYKL